MWNHRQKCQPTNSIREGDLLTPSIYKPSPGAVADMNQDVWKKDEMNGEWMVSLAYHAEQLKIPYFCGVFDLETLPSSP